MKFVVQFIIFSIVSVATLSAEQSVYSDSDFTSAETIAKTNSREILVLKQNITQLKESIEGLKSIIEGQNNEIATLKQKSNNNLEEIINQLSQRVAVLESKPAVSVKMPSSQERSSSAKTRQDSSSKTPAKIAKDSNIPAKISSKKLFKDSVLNFTKSKLTEAKKGFKELLKRSYKKASTQFYLGEIAYKKGKYKNAIEHYQQSATINENAEYMDKLLFHTAVALKRKGKSSEAKAFFQAVVDGYPKSQVAHDAKKYLGHL